MEREFNKYYEKTYDVLGDLATLAGPDVSPIVNQASFYLTELKKINDDIRKIEKINGPVFRFVSTAFKELITCMLLKKDDLKEVVITGTGDYYSLANWNKILDSFSELIAILNIFILDKEIEFKLEQNGIRVITYLGLEQNLISRRKECYKILRKLFSKETILTFKIIENDERIKLDLFLNISHSNEVLYECVIGGSKVRLGFSNLFEQYVIGSYEAEKLGEHICLVITDDLQLERYNHVPKHFTQVLGDHQIIHFSFLFRPVSIIIPCRGELKKILSSCGLGDTGSGETDNKKQDVNAFYTNKKCQYINIFEIIS